jgi:hypothetical protein
MGEEIGSLFACFPVDKIVYGAITISFKSRKGVRRGEAGGSNLSRSEVNFAEQRPIRGNVSETPEQSFFIFRVISRVSRAIILEAACAEGQARPSIRKVLKLSHETGCSS